MGEFCKKDYDKEYNKTHRSMIRVNVSNDEKAQFEEYCAKIGVVPSTHLKRLINQDAVQRGMEPIFKGACAEDKTPGR
ncbi:MAG: hypothetical protein IJO98_06075 [Clostridia bacterium]|nr:hypothetical protein [Clostridia bacterium]